MNLSRAWQPVTKPNGAFTFICRSSSGRVLLTTVATSFNRFSQSQAKSTIVKKRSFSRLGWYRYVRLDPNGVDTIIGGLYFIFPSFGIRPQLVLSVKQIGQRWTGIQNYFGLAGLGGSEEQAMLIFLITNPRNKALFVREKSPVKRGACEDADC